MNLALSSSPPRYVTLVVGAGGLLGSALTRTLRAAGDGVVLTSAVAWTTGRAQHDLTGALKRLSDVVGYDRVPWRVAWCAGAGVTGTTQELLDEEVSTLSGFLDQVSSSRGLPGGTLFLASSAGGLYAGGRKCEPYDEHDAVQPISAYGRAKLASEELARKFADSTGHAVVVGRIANLYGPGQNLNKAQGLISHLCRSDITRQPTSVYVSLDTIRDYLYVDDCAAMVSDLLDLVRPNSGAAAPIIKVLASQQGVTVAGLIAACRQVFKRAPRVVLGTSANARFQVRDLRFRSLVWLEIDRRALTPLPAGIAATAAGIMRAHQSARF